MRRPTGLSSAATSKMKESIKSMVERVTRDPARNHCANHGVITEWIEGRCAPCVHQEEHREARNKFGDLMYGVGQCEACRKLSTR